MFAFETKNGLSGRKNVLCTCGIGNDNLDPLEQVGFQLPSNITAFAVSTCQGLRA